MLQRYNTGEVIHDILSQVRRVEVILGVEGGGNVISTNNVTISNQFTLQYTDPNNVLFVDGNYSVLGKSLSELIVGKTNQINVIDIGSGNIRIGAPQDINTTSDIQFNNLKLTGTSQLATIPTLHDWGVELVGSTNNETTFSIQRSDNLSSGATILFQKSQNTITNPTNTLNDDILGSINFSGYNGSTYQIASSIYGKATENYTPTANGSQINFKTTQKGSIIPTIQLVIDQNGSVHGLSNVTGATNTLMGSLIVNGGVGVTENLTVQGSLYVPTPLQFKKLFLRSTIESTSTSTGTLTLLGGAGIGGSFCIEGTVHIINTTNAINASTGALIIDGGLSVNKDIYINGTLTSSTLNYDNVIITESTNSTDTSTGALRTEGGMGIGGDLSIDGHIDDIMGFQTMITSTIATTSATSGALIVTGGSGIGGNISIGKNILIEYDPTSTARLGIPIVDDFINAYIFSSSDDINLVFNGYYDGSAWNDKDNSYYTILMKCHHDYISFNIGTTTSNSPRKMFSINNENKCTLYYADSTPTNESVYAQIYVDDNTNLNLITTGTQINIGDTELNHKIRFLLNTGLYGYLYNNGDDFTISTNGYWDGLSWVNVNASYPTSCITVTDGAINHMISTSNGTAPKLMTSLDNVGVFKIHNSTDDSKYGALQVNADGSMSLYSTNLQINMGTSTYKIRFATGMTGSVNDPWSYIVSNTSLKCVALDYNGYWDGASFINDTSRGASEIGLFDDRGFELSISTGVGTSPIKKYSLDNLGNMKLYSSDISKYANFITNSSGNLMISSSNNIIFGSHTINIANTFSSTSSTTGSVIVSGGIGISSNMYINGTLDVQCSATRTCNNASANVISKDSVLLWKNVGNLNDNYFKLYTYNTSNDSRGIKIDGGGQGDYGINIMMPFIISKGTSNPTSILKLSYDATKYSTLSLDNAGKLTMDTNNGNIVCPSTHYVNVLNTNESTNSTTGSLIVTGGMFGKSISVGGYITPSSSYEKTLMINESLMIWDLTSNILDSYFLLNLQDKNINDEVDNRSLVINNGGQSFQNIYVSSDMCVYGQVNPLPSSNWCILMYSLVSGAYECSIILKTPDGRESELIIHSKPSLNDIKSRENNFSDTLSGRIMVGKLYEGNDFGNTLAPTGYLSVLSSSYTSQEFVISSTTKVSQIVFWAYTDSQPFPVTITLYDGSGIGGAIETISRATIGKNPSQINCIMAGAIGLISGNRYTLKINGAHNFYIGYTTATDEPFVVNGSTQSNKWMSYIIKNSTTLSSYVVMVKRAQYGTTYEMRANNTNAVMTCVDTGTTTLYSTEIAYDTYYPPQSPNLTYSENVYLLSTVNATSTSTGSLIISGGLSIGENMYTPTLTILGTVNSTSQTTGTLIVTGGIGCGKSIYTDNFKIEGNMNVNNEINWKNSTKTGKIQYYNVNGLIVGPTTNNLISIDANDKLYVLNTSESTSDTTGSLICSGGMNILKTTIIGSSVNSTSTSTGSLLVAGGMRISKKIYVGGNVVIENKNIVEHFNYSNTSKVYDDNLLSFKTYPIIGNTWVGCVYSSQLGLYIMYGSTNDTGAISYNGTFWTTFDFGITGSTGLNHGVWISELSKFVIVGNTGRSVYSSDGITWAMGSGLSSATWRSICWSKSQSKLATVCDSTATRLKISTDGISWSDPSPGISSSYLWTSICYSEQLNLYVAVSSNNAISTSADLNTWTTPIAETGAFWSVSWSPEIGIFVAVGVNVIKVSINGTTWTSITSPYNCSWKNVLWIPEYHMFIITGHINLGSDVNTYVAYSYDARTWTMLTTPLSSSACYSSTYSPVLKQLILPQSNTGVLCSSIIYPKYIAPQTIDSTSTSTGSAIVFGGCGINKDLLVNGQMVSLLTTDSTSESTGSVIVSSGIGISQKVNIGGTLNIGANSITCSTTSIGGTSISYSSGEFSGGIFTGPTTVYVNIKYSKICNVVTLYCPTFNTMPLFSSGIFSYNQNLPTGFYSTTTNIYLPCVYHMSGTGSMGFVFIAMDGSIQIWGGANSTDVFALFSPITLGFECSYIV